MIAFRCPQCKTALHRPDTDAGNKIVCPSCGQRVQIPRPRLAVDRTVLGELQQDNPTVLGEELEEPGLLQQAPPPQDAIVTDLLQPLTASKRAAHSPPEASVPIRFTCPYCQSAIKSKADKAGLRVKCPKCSLPIEVPLPKGQLLETVTSAPPLPAPPALPGENVSEPFATEAQRPGRTFSHSLAVILIGTVCGGAFFIGLLVVLIFLAGGNARSTSQIHASRAPAPALERKELTEADARDQLKSILDAWVADERPVTVARHYPRIEFVDPYFSDGLVLVRYDIERGTLYSALGKCDLWVRLVYRRIDGEEGNFNRQYEVNKPDERGTWRIQVNPASPAGPGVSNAPSLATAREQLKLVLDAWVAGIWKAQLSKKYPTVDFSDLDYSDTVKLFRYDFGKADGPLSKGTWKIYVFLVHRNLQNEEFRVLKVYEVEKPDDGGVWHIRGYQPPP